MKFYIFIILSTIISGCSFNNFESNAQTTPLPSISPTPTISPTISPTSSSETNSIDNTVKKAFEDADTSALLANAIFERATIKSDFESSIRNWDNAIKSLKNIPQSHKDYLKANNDIKQYEKNILEATNKLNTINKKNSKTIDNTQIEANSKPTTVSSNKTSSPKKNTPKYTIITFANEKRKVEVLYKGKEASGYFLIDSDFVVNKRLGIIKYTNLSILKKYQYNNESHILEDFQINCKTGIITKTLIHFYNPKGELLYYEEPKKELDVSDNSQEGKFRDELCLKHGY